MVKHSSLQCSAANNLPAAPETWLAERWGKHYKTMKPGLHNAAHRRAEFQAENYGAAANSIADATGALGACQALTTWGVTEVSRGSVTVKVVPSPRRLCTAIDPPCASAIHRQMASPRPAPGR